MKTIFCCFVALLLSVSLVEAQECRLQEQLFEVPSAVNQYGGPVFQKLYSCDGREWFTEPPVVSTPRQSVESRNYNRYYDRPKHNGYKDLFRVHVEVNTRTHRGFVPPRYEYHHRSHRSQYRDHSRSERRRSSDYRYRGSAITNDGPAITNDGPAITNDGPAFSN